MNITNRIHQALRKDIPKTGISFLRTMLMFCWPVFSFGGSSGKNIKQLPEHEYKLESSKGILTLGGKDPSSMQVNGSFPGPTLRFTEGEKNNMDVETSVHWHGLLRPNFYDGLPYLNTPLIEPGETQNICAFENFRFKAGMTTDFVLEAACRYGFDQQAIA